MDTLVLAQLAHCSRGSP